MAPFTTWSGQDFQTSIYDLLISPLIFRANAGNAEVDGIEAELNTLLTPNLTLGLGATYNQSQLTEDFNSTVDPDVVWAPNGRRLPYSPEFRFAGNARYTWNQTANWNGFAHISYSYTGRMLESPNQYGAVSGRYLGYKIPMRY